MSGFRFFLSAILVMIFRPFRWALDMNLSPTEAMIFLSGLILWIYFGLSILVWLFDVYESAEALREKAKKLRDEEMIE